MPHLFDIDDLSPERLRPHPDPGRQPGTSGPVLAGQGVALLFEKPSARTRNSTEMAVVGLGGHPVYIQAAEVGLDTRESAEDVARTLGCYHRILCARVFDHALLPRMAGALDGSGFDVPVINLLSDDAHPCQAVADIITLARALGPLAGRSLAYIGDANNMARSLVKAALMEGMDVRVASPVGYDFSTEELAALAAACHARSGRGGTVRVDQRSAPTRRPGVDALYTDVWTSMGQEEERAARLAAFAGFTIDDALLSVGRHPRPWCCTACRRTGARRSRASVLEGPHSVVWRRRPIARPPCTGSWPGPLRAQRLGLGGR